MSKETIDFNYPAAIENIDFAIYNWLNDDLNLFCNTANGFQKVPIIWVIPERAAQVKQNPEYYDMDGSIKPPVITIERTGINKDVKNNGIFYANIPDAADRTLVSRRINQKKTTEFTNATEKRANGYITFASKRKKPQKIVYEYKNMLLPVYANISYSITITTMYQQQMNELLQPLITRTGSSKYFIAKHSGYTYEAFIGGDLQTTNTIANLGTDERKYSTKITITALGKLVSGGSNEHKKIIKVYENPIDLILNRDKVKIIESATKKPNVQFQGGQNAQEDNNRQVNIMSGISSTGGVSRVEYIITPNGTNTVDGISRLDHYLNNKNIQVTIIERDTGVNIVANIYYYDNYIEIDGLEYGITYVVTIVS